MLPSLSVALKFNVRFFSLAILFAFVWVAPSQAGQVAVVCTDAPDFLKSRESVSARIRAWSFAKKAESNYDRVDYHLCRQATDAASLLQRLLARSQKHRTDFIDIRLEHSPGTQAFDQTVLRSVKGVSAQNSSLRLRLGLTSTRPLTEAMRALSFGNVIQTPEGGSELLTRGWLLQFLESWTQSFSVEFAQRKAAQLLSDITPSLGPVTASVGTEGRTEPVKESLMGFRLYSAFALPGAVVGSQMDGVPQLIDQVAGPAWELLKTTFPHPIQGLPGRIDEELTNGELVWIDGDGLRYFLSPLRDWLGSDADQLLTSALGLRLSRSGTSLVAALYFREAQRISLSSLDINLPQGELRSIRVPRTLRIAIQVRDGVAALKFLPVVDDPLALEAAWNGISLWLEPKGVQADLNSGDARVEASVLGGLVRFVARLNLFEKRFDGVDFWQSIDQKRARFSWPKLKFEKGSN